MTSIKFFVLLVIAPRLLSAGNAFLWEGFEREINWYASDAATGRQVNAQFYSEGGHSLALPFKAVAKSGKAIYARYETMDWSPYGSLLLDVYNPTDIEGLACSVIIYSTTRWVAHEAFLPPLAKGWNKDIRVDLNAAHFSTPGSGYKPTAYLVGRGDVEGLAFLIQPGQVSEGTLYLDNIRLERSGLVTMGDFSLNSTLEGTGSTGDLAYLPPRMRLQPADFRAIESFEGPVIPWTASVPEPELHLEQSSDFASQGTHGLSVQFPELPSGFDIFMNGIEGRLADSRQLRMDIYNPGTELGVSLWMTDSAGNYYSTYKTLSHGWNTPVFDFTNQNDWNGAVIDAKVLSSLTAVAMTVYSTYPGRLVFDGLSTSSIFLKGASKLGLLASLSYNPNPQFEVIADARVEDTYYGADLSGTRGAGAEAYLDAAGLRWDQGEFRNKALYRRRVTAFDNPITPLLQSEKLGNEIAAWESGGRVGDVELQALAASRLEYDHYNSRLPTGLGPENVVGLRARKKIWGGTRLGGTLITHQTAYGRGVRKLPPSRQTVGMDLDGQWQGDKASLSWAAEAAQTSGDRFQDAQVVFAPDNDRGYVGARLDPQWGRLGVDYFYSLLGYDFDAELTKYGANEEWHAVSVNLNLEDLGVLSKLKELPLYDRSLGNNLHIELEYFNLITRSRYLDGLDGQIWPVNRISEFSVALENDAKAKPNFTLKTDVDRTESQWSCSESHGSSLSLKFPLWFDIGLTLKGGHSDNLERNKGLMQSGLTGTDSAETGLEWFSSRNLSVNVNAHWSGTLKSWEGVQGPYEQHVKWIAGIQQNLGPNSVVRLDYGLPALLGVDFGLQDTIEVLTLTAKMYL